MMTEEQWRTSDDPAAMIKSVRGRLSSRKLRLFAVACLRQVWSQLADDATCDQCNGKGVLHPRLYCPKCNDNGAGASPGRINRIRRAVEVAEQYAEGTLSATNLQEARVEAGEVGTPLGWAAHLCCYESSDPDVPAFWQKCHWRDEQLPAQANVLRDICGLFTPDVPLPPHILTPEVRGMAEAAYECRAGKKCEQCGGGGQEPTYGPPRQTHHCGVKMQERSDSHQPRDGYYPTWCPRCWWTQLPEHTGYRQCGGCGGTGRIETGELDPVRLAVLSDALEEAGLPAETSSPKTFHKCPRCRVGGRYCSLCHGTTSIKAACKECFDEKVIWTGMDGMKWVPCVHCPKPTPNPLLAHLRSAGPHYRGMWSLDRILGRT